MVLRFIGPLDESSILDKVEIESNKNLIFDLGEIDYINSYGAREWLRWITSLGKNHSLRFINCNTIFLDYVNMIDGFVPKHGVIESFKIPYYCESCDLHTTKLYDSAIALGSVKDIPSSVKCIKCHAVADIDVITPGFFKFLERS